MYLVYPFYFEKQLKKRHGSLHRETITFSCLVNSTPELSSIPSREQAGTNISHLREGNLQKCRLGWVLLGPRRIPSTVFHVRPPWKLQNDHQMKLKTTKERACFWLEKLKVTGTYKTNATIEVLPKSHLGPHMLNIHLCIYKSPQEKHQRSAYSYVEETYSSEDINFNLPLIGRYS